MSPSNQKKGPANIPVKTAIHVSYAVMIAAAYALAKNPATVKNSSSPARQFIRWSHQRKLACGGVFALDGAQQIVYRIFTINLNLERLK